MQYRRHQTVIARWLVLGTFFCFILVAQKELFQVEDISCSLLDGQACPEFINDGLIQLRGEALLFNRLDQKISQLKFTQPAQVNLAARVLPSQIIVSAQTEPGIYQITDTLQAVSPTGDLFAVETSVDLPQVRVPDLTTNSNASNDELATAIAPYHQQLLKTLSEFSRFQIKVKNLDWQTDQWILINLDQGWQILAEANQLTTAPAKVKLILDSDATRELNPSQTQIDLRFRLPVLRNRS